MLLSQIPMFVSCLVWSARFASAISILNSLSRSMIFLIASVSPEPALASWVRATMSGRYCSVVDLAFSFKVEAMSSNLPTWIREVVLALMEFRSWRASSQASRVSLSLAYLSSNSVVSTKTKANWVSISVFFSDRSVMACSRAGAISLISLRSWES